jgi:CheY-like chemotaxis protein
VIDCPLGKVTQLPAEAPVVDYLVKPVTRDRLLVSLRQLGPHVRHVLVVDDDPDMARLIAQMVNGAGRRYHVTIAYDGAEALRALHEAPPDALLLDILMPGIDGHAVLREMRVDDRLRSLPTIVVSAPSQRDDGISAGRVVLGQDGGLTVGQAMRLVKAGLDLLFPATGAQETDPALPRASLD